MRRFAFAAVAALLLAAPAAAQAPQPLRVVTTALEASSGPVFAQRMGYFRREGLDADVTLLRSGEAAAAAVIGGSADVGVANTLSLAIAHAKGLGLVLIAPASEYVDTAPTTALVVLRDSPIRTARDLDGKTIGIIAVGDLTTISTEAWLDRNGLDHTRVKFVEIPNAQMAAALERGTVDAAMINSPALQAALERGRILGKPYGAIAPRFIANGFYAKSDWLARHLDEARRFARAVIDAQQWAMHNPAASAQILVDANKLSPEFVAKMSRSVYAERFDPALLQPLIDTAARYKTIPGSFPATELYDPTL